MGNCVANRRTVRVCPANDTHEALETTSVEPDIEDGVQPSVQQRDSSYRNIDPNIPESFYPNVVSISREEEQCRLTRGRITVKETEKPLRSRVERALSEWRKGAVLGQIESHALSIPADNTASVESLATSLTHPQAKYVKCLSDGDSRRFELQTAKAYAIYFWIANNIRFSQDMWQSFISSTEMVRWKTEAEEVLEKRACLAIGYTNLFNSIATAVGLKSRVVMGNIKTSHDQSVPSHDCKLRFEPSRLNQHWWNVVCIEGVWIPVDCTCGAGMIAPHINYKHKFMPHFFAVPPEHLVFTHIPTQPEWQLLQDKVSLEKLSLMISPSTLSMSLGIQPLFWAETINIGHNSHTTTVKIPVRVPHTLQISVELRRANDCLYNGQSVQQGTNSQLQATYIKKESNNEVVVYASVPDKGIYFLDIHAHQNRNSNFKCFSYMINCMTEPTRCTGFPTVYDMPSIAFQFKLLYWNTPKAANACENDQGKMDLVFECLPNTQFYHCLLSGQTSGGLPDLNPQYYCTTISHDLSNHSLHKLSVVFPSRGWWTIYLCAAKSSGDIDVSGYTALLNYPLLVRKGLRRCSYPYVQSSDVYFDLPEPISCTGTEILVVPFFSAKYLDFYSYLCYESLQGQQEKQYTLIQTMGGFTVPNEWKYSLHVIFPKPGKWCIQVLAHAVEQPPSEGYLPLFNMIVKVEGCMENAVFPVIEQEITRKYNIKLLHENSVIKLNGDEEMFSLNFQAPRKIKFDHYIESVSEVDTIVPGSSSATDGYSTYLHVKEQDSIHNSYELKAVFPKAAKWNVVLCAAESYIGSTQIALRVPLSILNVLQSQVFPAVHPALAEFGITFSKDYPLYPKVAELPEFSFEFISPKAINYAWTLQDVQNGKQTPHSSNVYLENTGNTHGDKEMYKLRVIFPKPGVWLVQVVARAVLTDIVEDNTLSLSLHYQPVFDVIIEASDASRGHMTFPRLFEPFHSKFGLTIKNPDVPLPSRANHVPATCTIKFYSPPGVLFWHHCKESSQLQGKKITRMTSNPDTGLHELCADINKRGQWTVYLHAKFANDTSKNWIAVLQHTVIVKTPKSCSSSSLMSQ